MIEHGVVKSTIEPKTMEIDANSVWVAEDIKPFKDEESEGFEYKLTQYSKDEYIQQLDTRDRMKSDAILELSDIISDMMEGDE